MTDDEVVEEEDQADHTRHERYARPRYHRWTGGWTEGVMMVRNVNGYI